MRIDLKGAAGATFVVRCINGPDAQGWSTVAVKRVEPAHSGNQRPGGTAWALAGGLKASSLLDHVRAGWKGYSHAARALGVNEKAIQRSLRVLEGAGLVTRAGARTSPVFALAEEAAR